MRASVPVCMCVSNWAVLRVWRALESMLVGHQATEPASQRAATLVGRAPATLPPSQLAQLPSTATSPPCPTLSRLECATTQRAPRDVCLTTNKGFRLGAQVRKTCAFLCAFLPKWTTKVSTSCFLRIPTGKTRDQSQQQPAPDILLLPCCLQVLVIACWFQGVSCFYLPLQASTTPTYKVYTRYREDRGCV